MMMELISRLVGIHEVSGGLGKFSEIIIFIIHEQKTYLKNYEEVSVSNAKYV